MVDATKGVINLQGSWHAILLSWLYQHKLLINILVSISWCQCLPGVSFPADSPLPSAVNQLCVGNVCRATC